MLQGLVRRLQGVRLTRRSLIRMAVAILGSFVLISGIVTIVFPPPLTDRAFRVAQRQGPGEAERFLISALRERPEDADGWITLARLRSSVLRSDAAVPPEVILPDGLEFDPEKLPRRSGSSTELRPAEFDAFLATSPVVFDSSISSADLVRRPFSILWRMLILQPKHTVLSLGVPSCEN